MGDYQSIFHKKYKWGVFEQFFSERYAKDTYLVPEDDYREYFWGRTACEFFTFYVIFSVWAFEAP
jgi:hypothetical protein